MAAPTTTQGAAARSAARGGRMAGIPKNIRLNLCRTPEKSTQKGVDNTKKGLYNNKVA